MISAFEKPAFGLGNKAFATEGDLFIRITDVLGFQTSHWS
jgi:hypothetical protein